VAKATDVLGVASYRRDNSNKVRSFHDHEGFVRYKILRDHGKCRLMRAVTGSGGELSVPSRDDGLSEPGKDGGLSWPGRDDGLSDEAMG
jgi:hypothetical protein